VWLNLGDSYAGSNCGSNDYRNNGASLSKNDAKYQGQKPGLSNGLKPKDLMGIPWRVAFALQADGWWLRQDIVWAKANPMPESVTDRCTRSHEYVFLLSKSAKYYYDAEAVKEPANIVTQRFKPVNATEAIGNMSTGDRRINYEKNRHIVATRNKRDVWFIATHPYKGAHFATFPPALVEPCIKAGSKPGDMVLDCFSGAGTVGVVCKQYGRDFIGIELNQEYNNLAKARIDATEG
jgi:DNA modification methylase